MFGRISGERHGRALSARGQHPQSIHAGHTQHTDTHRTRARGPLHVGQAPRGRPRLRARRSPRQASSPPSAAARLRRQRHRAALEALAELGQAPPLAARPLAAGPGSSDKPAAPPARLGDEVKRSNKAPFGLRQATIARALTRGGLAAASRTHAGSLRAGAGEEAAAGG